MKASADVATTAAIPIAAKQPQASTPTELPTVVASARRWPPVAALRTTSAVAAPGVTVSSAATGAKATRAPQHAVALGLAAAARDRDLARAHHLDEPERAHHALEGLDLVGRAGDLDDDRALGHVDDLAAEDLARSA